MKAISCPQCGSLIRNILPHQPISDCDYCGAKVIADEHFSASEPDDVEINKFRVPAQAAVMRPPFQPIFLAIAGIGAFFFLIIIIALFAE